MHLRAIVFGLAAVLGLAVIAIACGGDGGATQYDVTVRFNTSATQDELFEVGALLRTYDDDLEYFILETSPPIGEARLATDAPDFCRTVDAELEAKSYVDDVSCGPHVETDQADPDDEPVSTDND